MWKSTEFIVLLTRVRSRPPTPRNETEYMLVSVIVGHSIYDWNNERLKWIVDCLPSSGHSDRFGCIYGKRCGEKIGKRRLGNRLHNLLFTQRRRRGFSPVDICLKKLHARTHYITNDSTVPTYFRPLILLPEAVFFFFQIDTRLFYNIEATIKLVKFFN